MRGGLEEGWVGMGWDGVRVGSGAGCRWDRVMGWWCGRWGVGGEGLAGKQRRGEEVVMGAGAEHS